jgi:hypothetical protein
MYFWKRLSSLIGVGFCINISLFCITICNFSFSYTSSFSTLLLNRILCGFLNNLTNFVKNYTLLLFESKDHKKLLPLFSIFQHLGTVIGIFIGTIKLNQIISETTNLNKYFLSAWIVAVINLISFFFNLTKFRINLISASKRRTQFMEQGEFNLNDSQRKDNINNNENDRSNLSNINKINNVITKKSPMKKPKMYESMNDQDITSTNKKDVVNLDVYATDNSQHKEKTFQLDDFHSKRGDEVIEVSSIDDKRMKSLGNSENKGVNASNFSDFRGDSSNITVEFKPGEGNLIKLHTSTFSSNYGSKPLAMPAHKRDSNEQILNSPNNKMETIQNEGVENKSSYFKINEGKSSNLHELNRNLDDMKQHAESPTNLIHTNDSTKKKFYKNRNSSSFGLKQKEQKEPQSPPHGSLDRGSKTEIASLKNETLYSDKAFVFKISHIFTFLQVLDYMVYLIFYLKLLIPTITKEREFQYSIMTLAYSFLLFHILCTFFHPLLNSVIIKYALNSQLTQIKLAKYSIILSFFTTFGFFFSVFYFSEFSFPLILILALFFRNSSLLCVLICYNLLILKTSSVFKRTLNTFQNYFSVVVKCVIGILTSLIYAYIGNIGGIVILLISSFLQLIVIYYLFGFFVDLIDDE